MKEKYIVALGRVCIDEYYVTNEWPLMGEKKFVKPLEARIGGMGANAASVLAGYGIKVCYLDLLPKAAPSTARILEDFRNYSVSTQLIQFDPDIAETKCMIFLKEAERVIFITDVKRPPIRLEGQSRKLFFQAAYVYSTLPDLQELDSCDRVLAEYVAGGGKIAVDVEADSFTNAKEADHWFVFCSLVFMNQQAFDKYRGASDDADAARRLLELGPKMLVVTKGRDGCTVILKERVFSRESYRVQAVDTTGAGDTFNSSFLYGMIQGYTPEKAAEFASAAAARAVTAVGPRAGVAKAADVERFIRDYQV